MLIFFTLVLAFPVFGARNIETNVIYTRNNYSENFITNYALKVPSTNQGVGDLKTFSLSNGKKIVSFCYTFISDDGINWFNSPNPSVEYYFNHSDIIGPSNIFDGINYSMVSFKLSHVLETHQVNKLYNYTNFPEGGINEIKIIPSREYYGGSGNLYIHDIIDEDGNFYYQNDEIPLNLIYEDILNEEEGGGGEGPGPYVPPDTSNPKPFEVVIYEHWTGSAQFYIKGAEFPVYINKGLNYEDLYYLDSTSEEMFVDYGLENGVTYYYQFIDSTGYSYMVRYTPPFLVRQVYPLEVKQIEDTSVHLRYNEPYLLKKVFLNDEYWGSVDGTEFTITDLVPGTEYKVYLVGEEGHKSNEITFYTTNRINSLDKLFKELLLPPAYVDSNSDGLRDELEGINTKLETIIDKIGGITIGGTIDIIDGINEGATDWNDTPGQSGNGSNNNLTFPSEFGGDMPVIGTDYRGLRLIFMDLNNPALFEMMETIRNILLAILTVTFIFTVLSLFNITFKV